MACLRISLKRRLTPMVGESSILRMKLPISVFGFLLSIATLASGQSSTKRYLYVSTPDAAQGTTNPAKAFWSSMSIRGTSSYGASISRRFRKDFAASPETSRHTAPIFLPAVTA